MKNHSGIMRISRILLISVIVLTSCKESDPEPDPSRFLPNQTILEGFSIQSIAFDSEGTAWVGTFNSGIIKYSLSETQIFDSLNSPLTNEMVWDIAVDSKNMVWIGGDGLTKYDGRSFTRFTPENSDLPESRIFVIDIDSKDNVWFSSSVHQSGGLVKYDGQEFEVFTPENSPLPANSIEGIAIDKNDDIWLTAFQYVNETYIVKISNGNWEIHSGSEFTNPYFIFYNLAIDSQGRVLALYNHFYATTTADYGYFSLLFHSDSVQQFSFESENILREAIVDDMDKFWCTLIDGYAIYDGESWKITRKEEFKSRSVFSIAQAKDGNIWIGTGSGIDIIKPE